MYITRSGRHHPVTPRELEVLRLAGKGLSDRQIACRLNISHTTVKKHLGAVYRKWAVYSRLEAVLEGLKRGHLSLIECA